MVNPEAMVQFPITMVPIKEPTSPEIRDNINHTPFKQSPSPKVRDHILPKNKYSSHPVVTKPLKDRRRAPKIWQPTMAPCLWSEFAWLNLNHDY
jgi:hypothetical protein